MVVALASLLAACAPVAGAPSTASGGATVSHGKLTIFAAASLKTALDRLVPAYESSHPGSTLTVSTDSSATLATQIEQGAPADIFLSADTANPARLSADGLTDGGTVAFAGNELTLIVPAADPAGVTTPADLARPGMRVVAAGDEVPITKYARQVVERLAQQPGYPPNFAARYEANVVSREDNVRAVVAKIELGEGDAAIVYVTDARASSKVRSIEIPDAANVSATYAGVVIRASANGATAHAFLDWLSGPEAQQTLGGYGFLPAPSS